MNEIEYVDQVIDRYGISFFKEKRQKVTDFRKPEQAREIKQILGLISQFRDHTYPAFCRFNCTFHRYDNKLHEEKYETTYHLNAIFLALQEAVNRVNCQLSTSHFRFLMLTLNTSFHIRFRQFLDFRI